MLEIKFLKVHMHFWCNWQF